MEEYAQRMRPFPGSENVAMEKVKSRQCHLHSNDLLLIVHINWQKFRENSQNSSSVCKLWDVSQLEPFCNYRSWRMWSSLPYALVLPLLRKELPRRSWLQCLWSSDRKASKVAHICTLKSDFRTYDGANSGSSFRRLHAAYPLSASSLSASKLKRFPVDCESSSGKNADLLLLLHLGCKVG